MTMTTTTTSESLMHAGIIITPRYAIDQPYLCRVRGLPRLPRLYFIQNDQEQEE